MVDTSCLTSCETTEKNLRTSSNDNIVPSCPTKMDTPLIPAKNSWTIEIELLTPSPAPHKNLSQSQISANDCRTRDPGTGPQTQYPGSGTPDPKPQDQQPTIQGPGPLDRFRLPYTHFDMPLRKENGSDRW